MQNLTDRVEMELWQRLNSRLYERFQGNANGLYDNEAKEWIWDKTYFYIDMIAWHGHDIIGFETIEQYQHQNKNNGN